MRHKIINTGVADILLVELPEGARDPKVFNDKGKAYLSYFVRDGKGLSTPRLYLPEGFWKSISFADKVTEEQAKEVIQSVDWVFTDGSPKVVRYRNYDGYSFDEVTLATALESLDSLYEANNVLWNNPVKHPKQMNMIPASIGWYKNQVERHEKAQKNVWSKERTIILIKQK